MLSINKSFEQLYNKWNSIRISKPGGFGIQVLNCSYCEQVIIQERIKQIFESNSND